MYTFTANINVLILHAVRKAAFTGIVRDNFSCFVCFDAEKIT